MNFSPTTTEALAMARQLPRARAQGIRPHKRPTGGRPNPCAMHKEASHPLAEMARAGKSRRSRRHQQLRSVTKPGYELVSDAILAGDIPVGVIITDKDVSKAIKLSVTGGMPMLALSLAQHRLPARLREVSNGKWVADIL